MNKKHISPGIGKDCFTCPHCGVVAAFTHYDLSRFIRGPIGTEDIIGGIKVFICQCDQKERLIWLGDELIYPPMTAAPPAADDMPPDVRKIYDEAAKVSAASPRAAAALLRLAFESLLKGIWQEPHVQEALADKDKKREQLTLGWRVKLLYDIRLLSPSAHMMAKAVHLPGNEASHDPGLIQAEEEKELVPMLFEFLNLLVEELITRPERAAAAADEAEKRKAK